MFFILKTEFLNVVFYHNGHSAFLLHEHNEGTIGINYFSISIKIRYFPEY